MPSADRPRPMAAAVPAWAAGGPEIGNAGFVRTSDLAIAKAHACHAEVQSWGAALELREKEERMEAAMEEGRAHGVRPSSGRDSATAGKQQPGPRDQSAHDPEATRGRSAHQAQHEGGKETAPRAGRRSDSTAKAKGSAPAAGVQELAASPRSREAKPPSPEDRRSRPAERHRGEEEARKLASIQFPARRPGGAPRRSPLRDRASGKQGERRAADRQGDRAGRSSSRPAAQRNP